VGSNARSETALNRLSIGEAWREIEDGVRSVHAATGIRPVFFRFPLSASNAILREKVRAVGLSTVPWTVEGQDWKLADPDAIVERVISKLRSEGRGIFGLHDSLPQTVVALPRLLRRLADEGFLPAVLVPVRASAQ
jgi:peptidoglycan/xylan/chitin deacetylase (PgdA/CDA1 family)